MSASLDSEVAAEGTDLRSRLSKLTETKPADLWSMLGNVPDLTEGILSVLLAQQHGNDLEPVPMHAGIPQMANFITRTHPGDSRRLFKGLTGVQRARKSFIDLAKKTAMSGTQCCARPSPDLLKVPSLPESSSMRDAQWKELAKEYHARWSSLAGRLGGSSSAAPAERAGQGPSSGGGAAQATATTATRSPFTLSRPPRLSGPTPSSLSHSTSSSSASSLSGDRDTSLSAHGAAPASGIGTRPERRRGIGGEAVEGDSDEEAEAAQLLRDGWPEGMDYVALNVAWYQAGAAAVLVDMDSFSRALTAAAIHALVREEAPAIFERLKKEITLMYKKTHVELLQTDPPTAIVRSLLEVAMEEWIVPFQALELEADGQESRRYTDIDDWQTMMTTKFVWPVDFRVPPKWWNLLLAGWAWSALRKSHPSDSLAHIPGATMFLAAVPGKNKQFSRAEVIIREKSWFRGLALDFAPTAEILVGDKTNAGKNHAQMVQGKGSHWVFEGPDAPITTAAKRTRRDPPSQTPAEIAAVAGATALLQASLGTQRPQASMPATQPWMVPDQAAYPSPVRTIPPPSASAYGTNPYALPPATPAAAGGRGRGPAGRDGAGRGQRDGAGRGRGEGGGRGRGAPQVDEPASRECVVCYMPFTPRDPKQKYCTKQCRPQPQG
jgi:hypothetical protein